MRNFNEIIKNMQSIGMKVPGDKVRFKIPGARDVLHEVMANILSREGKELTWLPEYDKVARWLSDNEGRGLFLFGNCGRGKSLLCRYAIPIILMEYCRKIVSVYDIHEMNANIDDVLHRKIVALDDIGTEEVSVKYGERREAFGEIMDMAEKNGNLVIVSTNLDAGKLQNRYGPRVLDRIKSTTLRVMFEGKSLRK